MVIIPKQPFWQSVCYICQLMVLLFRMLMLLKNIVLSFQMMVSLDRTPHVWTQEEVMIIIIITQVKIIIVIIVIIIIIITIVVTLQLSEKIISDQKWFGEFHHKGEEGHLELETSRQSTHYLYL